MQDFGSETEGEEVHGEVDEKKYVGIDCHGEPPAGVNGICSAEQERASTTTGDASLTPKLPHEFIIESHLTVTL